MAKINDSAQHILRLLGCVIVIVFGILYGSLVITTQQSCMLLNKSYTSFSYSCIRDIDLCEKKVLEMNHQMIN
jgi:hypothetical protein